MDSGAPVVKLLVVEDEDAIAGPLVEGLTREGFEVDRVASGQAALDAPQPDVVLLDLRLPDMDGYAVCRLLRERSSVPIIMVTARGQETDRVLGLELGADDYIVKPFGLRELVARVRAVGRRARSAPDERPVVVLGPLEVDSRSRRVRLGGEELALTPKEFDILALLAGDPGAAVTRETILEHVWDTQWYGPTKMIDVHVASLRRKLGNARWIETVRGVGFRISAPG